MRFQLDHDWQGNMSTPRARVGDGVKTHLLLVLCAIWILLGLVGHEPWKPLESTDISIIKNVLDNGNLIAPLASGATSIETPPFYYLSAAIGAKLLSPILSIHDGARLMNAVWLSIILLMVGMTGREFWSRGVGRQATFILIGTIGLLISAHSLSAEVAGLASSAAGFYALALCKRRPWRASILFGAALSIGFLSYGLIPSVVLISTALILPLLFKVWRTRSYFKFLVTSIIIASPLIIFWVGLMYRLHPTILISWWESNASSFTQMNHLYFLRILVWYAWPALPFSFLGLWRFREQLLIKAKFQLMICFFFCCLLCLGLGADSKDTNALPLLLPLVAMAAGSVEHLKRGAAAAMNWFGVMLFGIMGIVIWLGWFAMTTGYPSKIKERILFLSGLDTLSFSWPAFIIAVGVTLIWILVCLRAKQTNKSTVTNWAVGITLGWGLLMTLWLPLIDSAKSYQPVFTSLNRTLPKHFTCVSSLNVPQAQSLLFNYYTNIKLEPVEMKKNLNCDLYLIQDERGSEKVQPKAEWQLIWSGKRAAERRESFRLFKRVL